MKSTAINTAVLLVICGATTGYGQSVARERPAEWDNLVFGCQFKDRFLPVPIMGNLTTTTWGGQKVVPRDVLNGIEDPDWRAAVDVTTM